MAGTISHGLTEKRSRRITFFHWASWGIGAIIMMIAFFVTGSLWTLTLVVPVAVIGAPLKDDLTFHGRLINNWRARKQRRRNNGTRRSSPLRSDPTAEPASSIELVGKAVAAVRNKDGSTGKLPMFTDPDGTFLTLIVHVAGQSTEYLSSDSDGRYQLDLSLVTGLAKALSATRNPNVTLVQGRMFRPADSEVGIMYHQRRLNSEIREAAASGDPTLHDPVDIRIGQHAYEAHDGVYGFAGEGVHYTALRMPWPSRRFRRKKIDLLDHRAFERSDIWVTISRVLQVYRNMGIKVELSTDDELGNFFQTVFNLRELKTLRYYRQRDRELKSVLGETFTGEDLPLPAVISSDTDGSGYIECDGTFFAAGYATKLNRPDLPPGFQEELTQLDDDTYYVLATYTDLPLLSGILGEKSKAAGKEALVKGIANNLPLDNISDPEGDIRINQIVELRRRLAETGGRAAWYHHLFSVCAYSAEELEDKWNDVVIQLGDLYDIQRVYRPNDIEDILLGQIGVKIDHP